MPPPVSRYVTAASELSDEDEEMKEEIGLLRLPDELLAMVDAQLRASAGGPFAAVRLRGTCSALRRRLPPITGVAAERLHLAEAIGWKAAEEAIWVVKHQKAKWEHHLKAEEAAAAAPAVAPKLTPAAAEEEVSEEEGTEEEKAKAAALAAASSSTKPKASRR